MDRYQFEDLISDYIENTLSLKQRKDFETYLEQNSEANEYVESVKKVMESMKSLPQVKTSAQFQSQLYQRIAKEKASLQRRQVEGKSIGFSPLIASLSLIAISALVVIGLQVMPEQSTINSGMQPLMSEQIQPKNTQSFIPSNGDIAKSELEEDSTESILHNTVTKDFDNQIHLVGNKKQ